MTSSITHVSPIEGFRLRVAFANGEVRLFDLAPYLDKGVFAELRDFAHFQSVTTIGCGVEWATGQDLSADTLYLRGVPLTAAENSAAPPAIPAP
ncbi:MAG: DUF2442 domain-containing protein [Candidatus Hydrogenedens sp.]|nr:DUF2442 domain-containing protein [Candidatus Hydrogenedens sp.]